MGPDNASAAPLVEAAPAKVNLSLTVLGRRADGYHELESLVVFARGGGAADRLSLLPGGPARLEIAGGEVARLADDADNLVMRAAKAALAACPELVLGAFRLDKRLPVAAGIGGGSADAAAALRLIRRANPALAAKVDWMGIAASIGADVSVCLRSRASMMSGRGERVDPAGRMPEVWAVLVNPRIALATAPVFRALGALPFDETRPRQPFTANFTTFDDLIAALEQRPNDLEATAARLCPAIAEVQAALCRLEGARLVRMSGSGPTCFALFPAADAAAAGAQALRRDRPGWWIEAAELV